MKKAIKICFILLALIFMGLQFVRPDITNPPVIESETLESSTKLPKNIAENLKTSCKDCHSNKTYYPWYSNIAPISWSLNDHIRMGRADLNFSKWNTYSKQKKLRKLEKICEEIQSGNMPHNQYLWIHRDAILSVAEKQDFCDWTIQESERITNEG